MVQATTEELPWPHVPGLRISPEREAQLPEQTELWEGPQQGLTRE